MAFLDTKTQRISWIEFNDVYGAMVLFFRAKTSEPIDRQYYERIKFYPLVALKGAIDKQIDENKPTASNFPSPRDLANACADWLLQNPDVREPLIVYDKYEDLDFPIEKLWKAFHILENNGKDAFFKYCDSVRMPTQDRERVVCKLKFIRQKEKAQEIANGLFEKISETADQ